MIINQFLAVSLFYTAQMQITKIQKLPIISTKGKKSFCCWYVQLFLNPEKIKTKSSETEIITSATSFCNTEFFIIWSDLKLLPSQRDDCHSILADFASDQFLIRIIDKGETS